MGSKFLSALALASLATATAVSAQSLDRLTSLLNGTPQGGWVKVNTTTFSSAFPTGANAVPGQFGSAQGIARAWAGFAWDPATSELLLWGGGHANYGGDEMYRWNASTGAWTRGSLPSKFDTSNANYNIIGNGAPQAAHTYDGNMYLPVNGMFMTLGGAAYPKGGTFQSVSGTTGPWLWDPAKGNANLVGGGDGTGWDPTKAGGNMWTNRYGNISAAGATLPSDFHHVTADNRVEGGKDVIYFTGDQYSSGFIKLYKITMGDVRDSGSTDKWEIIGTLNGSPATGGFAYQGVGVLDNAHNLFVRTGFVDPNLYDSIPSSESVFLVWDLATASSASKGIAKPVHLINEDGSAFLLDVYNAGMAFRSTTGELLFWSGKEDGKVYSTAATYDTTGKLKDTWVVKAFASLTTAQPTNDTLTGTLGKWKYVPELDAFIALEEWSDATGDASVWMYKPMAVANVPEPSMAFLFVGGLGLIWLTRRRLQS